MNSQGFSVSDIRTQFRVLNILFFALALGQLIFFAVVYYLPQISGSLMPTSPELHKYFQYLVPMFVAMGVVGGSFVHMFYINKSNSAATQTSLAEKVATYRLANIIRWALLEGGAILCVVALLLTQNKLYAYMFVVAYLVFLSNRPSAGKFARHFNLSDSEVSQMNSLLNR